ncbi:hypothetical protein EW145_g1076 [Phellinidium pouzarii]|uniref:18S rRNA (guanine(1575)-N(7))-methyltransferase Bud23 C-terminal domain-containing protein n=1 Tax=Phellinidium pouzarii TaxID=167371 RepID=A0A4S4LG12_9AGAM|nr:hypothetical protein EW145_g1076 [Phellinidium pouzarii]
MSRPELVAPPEIYYGDTEAKKYTANTRIQQIQSDMTYRALELLNLPPDEPKFILDIGCGSGLSGEILDEEGHCWIGVDIAPNVLICYRAKRWPWNAKSRVTCFYKTLGKALASDQEVLMQPSGASCLTLRYLFTRPSGFLVYTPSISVIQWLLNAETSHPTSSPPHRLMRFFTTLYAALRNPARAVLQFYPSSDDQIHLITSIAQKAGFGGGVVVDYPNSKKAKKVFLCLFVGSGGGQQVPKGLDGEEERKETVPYERRRDKERRREKSGKRKAVKAKDWIVKKKELYRQRGKEGVPNDSKFTGRKRRPVF